MAHEGDVRVFHPESGASAVSVHEFTHPVNFLDVKADLQDELWIAAYGANALDHFAHRDADLSVVIPKLGPIPKKILDDVILMNMRKEGGWHLDDQGNMRYLVSVLLYKKDLPMPVKEVTAYKITDSKRLQQTLILQAAPKTGSPKLTRMVTDLTLDPHWATEDGTPAGVSVQYSNAAAHLDPDNFSSIASVKRSSSGQTGDIPMLSLENGQIIFALNFNELSALELRDATTNTRPGWKDHASSYYGFHASRWQQLTNGNWALAYSGRDHREDQQTRVFRILGISGK